MISFVVLVISFILAGIGWIILDKRKYSGYPPGPPRLPLIGSMLSIPASLYPAVAFEKLSEIYGDVVFIKMGLVDAVTFNSYDSVKAILYEDKAAWRATHLSGVLKERLLNQNLGIALVNGEPWNVLRRFTIRTLREFGFEKASSMDVMINDELKKLIQQITLQMKTYPGKGFQAENMFTQAMTHILWRLVTGTEYELGNPEIQRLVEISDAWFKSTNLAFDLTIAFPFLWHWFPNWSGKTFQMKCIHELHQFMRNTIQKHRDCGEYKIEPKNYVDAFLAKIDETKDDPGSYFTDDQLLISLLDLFQAGGEISSKTLAFALLNILLNPSIQEKCWKEIDSLIGKDEVISAEMRLRLPYTQATVLECLRYSIASAFPPPRKAVEDFYFKGYFIKKDTPLLINLQAADMSISKWGDPQNFRPERFLTEDGTVDPKIASDLVLFGDGKRVCLGQGLAESSIFIFFTSILKSFKLEKVHGQPEPSMVPEPGITYSPQPFQILFSPRK